MIPTIVCQAYSLRDQVDASAVVAVALLVGWLGARLKGKFWPWATLALAILTPIAARFGLWPFDARWRDDCGATPDPSMLTIGAAVLFPLLVGGAYLISKWAKRGDLEPKHDVS